MQLINSLTPLVERWPVPDVLARVGIDMLVGRTSRTLAAYPRNSTAAFAQALAALPIAMHTGEANEQHYELPAAFFELFLGPQRKYSCCLYESESASLAEAEEAALLATVQNAAISDGQDILELGCGWGSLSLFMARRFPASRIVAVSNSHAQRAHIEQQISLLNLSNLAVITADMNSFEPARVFDRVVSIEMFEHMANWPLLLARIRSWLKPEGRLFIHIFSHSSSPYRFDHHDKGDWIAQHFFTGGLMPSHELLRECAKDFTIEEDWRWSGTHYRRTAENWLENYDRNARRIAQILDKTYGAEALLWRQRWRLFLLATARLFGHKCGEEWGVSHYRLRPLP